MGFVYIDLMREITKSKYPFGSLLARSLGKSQATVQTQLELLESKGFVKSEKLPKTKIRFFNLTDTGKKFLFKHEKLSNQEKKFIKDWNE